MKIELNNKIKITDSRPEIVKHIQYALTIDNPKWIENDRMERWNGKTPRHIKCFEHYGNILLCPRGFLPGILSIAKEYGEHYEMVDNRRTLPPVKLNFYGELRDYQQNACSDVYSRDMGVLCAPTGSGKTVVALALIANRQQPALIIVHTKELLHQWCERIRSFLGIDAGIIGDGKKQIGESPITVAMIQTLYKTADHVSPTVGHLIVDECHRTPNRTFTEAITAFNAMYLLGLSATPYRRDRLTKLIYWHLGPIVHKVDRSGLVKCGAITDFEVRIRVTDFETDLDPSTEYSQMLSQLCEDSERNRLICADVSAETLSGNGSILVLSDRKSHCEALKGILKNDYGLEPVILTGDIPHKDRQKIIGDLNQSKVKIMIATGQLIGEGFDCKGLSILFLATPIRFSGRVIQYMGRILRPAPGKNKAVLYDYVDSRIGVLNCSAKMRQKVYETA
jgi:superfamily II DNA or RNA helicase